MSSTTQGSSSFGSAGYTLVSSRPAFDQAAGQTWQSVYRGIPSSISALDTTLRTSGARTSIETSDGLSTLTASWARDPAVDPSAEVPWDRWGISVEEERVSLFSSPLAIAEASGFVNIAQYRSDIEEAARAGDDFPLDVGTYPIGHVIYSLLTQGEETYSEFRPLLRRTRTYTTAYPGAPWQVGLQGYVYTRAALVREFGIVEPLLSRIPFDPSITLPSGFVWGWRLASQDFDYVVDKGALKATETLSWRHGKYNAFPSGASLTGINVLIT